MSDGTTNSDLQRTLMDSAIQLEPDLYIFLRNLPDASGRFDRNASLNVQGQNILEALRSKIEPKLATVGIVVVKRHSDCGSSHHSRFARTDDGGYTYEFPSEPTDFDDFMRTSERFSDVWQGPVRCVCPCRKVELITEHHVLETGWSSKRFKW